MIADVGSSHGLCFTSGVLKKSLLLLTISVIGFGFSGCAYMTKSGRQQMEYRHYVSKHARQRQREIARAEKAANRQMKAKMKSAQPSEPQLTSTVQSAPDFSSEPVAPPVTVSASDSITNATEPSQP